MAKRFGCTKRQIMDIWEEAYELYADFSDLGDDDLVRVRGTMHKRTERILETLDKCGVTDKDVASRDISMTG